MKDKEDIKYFICPLEENESSENHLSNLESTKHQFSINQYLIYRAKENKAIKIYTYQLAYIFSLNKMWVINIDTKERRIQISPVDYLHTYINSYKEGVNYFKENYLVSPNILYGENSSFFIKDFLFNYYNKSHDNITIGWISVKQYTPKILSHEVMSKYGYYSGILDEADKFMEKHAALFKPFTKSDTPNENIADFSFNMQLVGAIHNLCNNIQFENLKDSDFQRALSKPWEYGNAIKIKDREILRFYYLISKLSETIEDRVQRSNWINNLLVALNIKRKTFDSKSKSILSDINNTANENFITQINELFSNKKL